MKHKADHHRITVKEVEIEKETENFVFINGRRVSKDTQYESFHDSRAEAKNEILKRILNEIGILESQMNYLKQKLDKAELL